MKNFPFTLINRKSLQKFQENAESKDNIIFSATEFVKEIENGNLNVNYDGEEKSEYLKENRLAASLISMRNQMKKIAQEENERKWVTEGLAQFVDILRSNSNILELSDNIITSLVKYLKANQGMLFLLMDEDPNDIHLQVTGCYAYERKKFIEQRFNMGEGLAGQSILEKETIYITDIPQNYIQITSGLGAALPTNVLIVPLKVNDKVFGVVEIASFEKLAKFQIEFVEKLSESIASSISAVKTNEKTKKLLHETQMQAEQMRAQEEEMRQNMEELAATQEEMQRSQKQTEEILNKEQERAKINIKNRQVLTKLTKSTNIQDGNIKESLKEITLALAEVYQITRASVWSYSSEKKSITLETLCQKDKNEFIAGGDLFQKDLPTYFKAMIDEEIIIAVNTFEHPALVEFHKGYLDILDIKSMLDVPFFVDGKLGGVICCENQCSQKDWSPEDVDFAKSVADVITIAFKSGESKKLIHEAHVHAENLSQQEEELRQNMEELAATQEEMHKNLLETEKIKKDLEVREQVFGLTTILSESDSFGNILLVNDKLCEVSKYSKEELIGKAHNIFRHPDMPKELFKLFWDTIKAGKVFKGIVKNKSKDGSHYWVDATIVPVKDENGKIFKYIGARYHITDDEMAEELYNRQAQKLGFPLLKKSK